ncbi:phosphotransferase enzyme family protein [Penicillium malachiteum]|uniref:Phosphotransferase enzyme family protein n=1 Tax=Penicillium malachiteum TaxID=1324776 RepID=A0AAD6HY02_9EURO|nr:phosphotransferase enzyme family protein [Penicillium malachiteum]
MDADELAVQRSDRIFQVWVQHLLANAPELASKLASQHCSGAPVTANRLANGAFNVCYQVSLANGSCVVVRFTALGRVIARREKVDDEVAILKFLGQHTRIPVPKTFGHGKSMVGPYIVMSFIEGNSLSGYLRASSQEIDTLSPSISMSFLRKAYSGMAEVILELSKPEFSFIGAIRESESGGWTVSKRPLTLNMNRIAQFSNIPHEVFKQGYFTNSADYFEGLALQHLFHLEHQHNDAVIDEADCRMKYIARYLFGKCLRQIAADSKHCNGPFRIYCDDLNPGNVLVNSDLVVTGVIDWEFSYAAPVEYSHAPPWWLLLERPEDWELDLDKFMVRFMPRFHTFLEVLRECESKKINDGSLVQSQCISGAMERSLETGMFWISLASRHGAMFDEIYWKFIDQKFFGPFTTIDDRLSLLKDEERENIETFVAKKLQQASERTLVIHYETSELVDF